MTKQELRAIHLKIRKECADRINYDFTPLITKTSQYKSASVIFTYISAGDEPSTHKFIHEALNDGKTVTVPYCVSPGIMQAVEIRSFDDLENGKYGILQPKQPYAFDKRQIDFILVPGICFDLKGYRVGYGGGYYDRFMKDTQAYKAGICYYENLIEKIPYNSYDIGVNAVITQKTTIKCL